jgi:2-iminoacetate synthase ThiH
MLAFSRVYLDNFPHIAASWFGEGKEIGMKALHYGADDFGGINMEENVHRAANFINKTDLEGIVTMIRQSGFTPVQRDSYYKKLFTYHSETPILMPLSQKVSEPDWTPILTSALING